MNAASGAPAATGPSPRRIVDSKTVEILALTVFRAIFRGGVHVPLKLKDVMDMDLVVKDGNVYLNLNNFQLTGPELTVWRLTFAYHGKPVIEYGRGIKNDLKVHLPQLFILLLEAWRNSMNKNKARARGATIASRDLVTLAATAGPAGGGEETIS
jgi:hypothetical protein